VIRREEIVHHSGHSGAWKVAYADFVTAMMAFFLLMWLLNATTEEQRKGLADYFSPTSLLSHNSSGTGKPFSGHTSFDEGTMVSDKGAVQAIHGREPTVPDTDDEPVDTLAQPRPHRTDAPVTARDLDQAGTPSKDGPHPKTGLDDRKSATGGTGHGRPSGAAPASGAATDTTTGATPIPTAPPPSRGTAYASKSPVPEPAAGDAAGGQGSGGPASAEEAAAAEQARLHQAASEVRQAVASDPALSEIARQLAIDETPEGLRLQIMDADKRPMFQTGSSVANDRARVLLARIAPILAKLPEPIAIAGHTDAAPYPPGVRGNWELSTERANEARRLLVEAGLPDRSVQTVTGAADRDPLLPADPLAAANRRIAIVVLRTVPAGKPATPPPPAPVVPAKPAAPTGH
jgi:chemotaxis protein MotB